MNVAALSASLAHQKEADERYPEIESLIRNRIASAKGPIFTTDAAGLFDAYLSGFPVERRQHYNCHACRRFIERYGNLATIADDGSVQSLLWVDDWIPIFFGKSFAAMSAAVRRAKVTGVFLSSDNTWGQPRTGEWTHLSGSPPKVFSHPTKTASQAMAEKSEEYAMLRRGLAEFSRDAIEQAVRVLKADAVDRSEKTLGIAEWLLKLHDIDAKGTQKGNLIWRAVATAPPGWCHVRSTMISTLLEDIASGLPFETINRKWSEKMHPLQYQRPTVFKAGNIERAEKIVKEMGLERSLNRRFARLDEVVAFWKPRQSEPTAPKAGGVFDHLKPRTVAPAVQLPPTTMTWDKFQRTILPNARQLEFQVQFSGPFYGLVTAVDADAPPILQWDGEPRNPVSWYFYHNGSLASWWGLSPNTWVPVTAAFVKPSMWHDPTKFKHQGEAIFFALEGAKDHRHEQGGGFFPEILRNELHEVHSVMEAYARNAAIGGRDEGTANGVAFDKGKPWGCKLRVNGSDVYHLDRWE